MSLDEQSFRNRVEWHREELLRIVEDKEKATDVFGYYDRMRLARWGILVRRGIFTVPSERAMAILKE